MKSIYLNLEQSRSQCVSTYHEIEWNGSRSMHPEFQQRHLRTPVSGITQFAHETEFTCKRTQGRNAIRDLRMNRPPIVTTSGIQDLEVPTPASSQPPRGVPRERGKFPPQSPPGGVKINSGCVFRNIVVHEMQRHNTWMLFLHRPK